MDKNKPLNKTYLLFEQLRPDRYGCKAFICYFKGTFTFFLDHQFTVLEIAVPLGVLLSSVKRRLCQYGLPVSASYAVITDEDLDHLVSVIVNDFLNCGYKRMTGFLLARASSTTVHSRVNV